MKGRGSCSVRVEAEGPADRGLWRIEDGLGRVAGKLRAIAWLTDLIDREENAAEGDSLVIVCDVLSAQVAELDALIQLALGIRLGKAVA